MCSLTVCNQLASPIYVVLSCTSSSVLSIIVDPFYKVQTPSISDFCDSAPMRKCLRIYMYAFESMVNLHQLALKGQNKVSWSQLPGANGTRKYWQRSSRWQIHSCLPMLELATHCLVAYIHGSHLSSSPKYTPICMKSFEKFEY